MKILDRIMAGLTMVAMLVACSEAELNTEATDIADGEMPVNLRVCIPLADDPAVTRSSVSGAEVPFTKIQMVCFASTGYLLGVREATASAWDANHEGTIKGSVPASTTRIHFIANKDDANANAMFGQQELIVMHSKESPFVTGKDDKISYWGYYKDADGNANSMAAWLKNPANKVYLVRDRAQVIVKNGVSGVTSMQWTIVNGLPQGFIAPYDRTVSGGFVVTGNVPAPAITITPLSSTSRFSDTTDWTDADGSQFIFEDRNETGDGKSPLVLLVKADHGSGAHYFKVQMENDLHQQIRFTRNHRYTLTIMELEETLGKDTPEAALAGDFVNGALKAVDENVTTVSFGGYKLQILEEKGTKVLFQNGTTGTIHFSFLKDDGTVDNTITATDFTAEWQETEDEENPVYANTQTAVSFDPATGLGTVTVNLSDINSTLKTGKVEISHKGGLIRYVTVYTKKEFKLAAEPTIKNLQAKHNSKDAYQVDFTLPSTDDYPESLYPLTIRIASTTLSPYRDGVSSTDYGMFSTAVATTADLEQSTVTNDWNYNAKSWGFWYEYTIREYPTGGKVIFLLEDVRSSRATQATNVGLYLYIPYFDGIKAVTP